MIRFSDWNILEQLKDLFALNRFGSEIMPISAVLDTIRSIAKVDESSLPVWEAALEGYVFHVEHSDE